MWWNWLHLHSGFEEQCRVRSFACANPGHAELLRHVSSVPPPFSCRCCFDARAAAFTGVAEVKQPLAWFCHSSSASLTAQEHLAAISTGEWSHIATAFMRAWEGFLGGRQWLTMEFRALLKDAFSSHCQSRRHSFITCGLYFLQQVLILRTV